MTYKNEMIKCLGNQKQEQFKFWYVTDILISHNLQNNVVLVYCDRHFDIFRTIQVLVYDRYFDICRTI
jgi:hypothetical protein